MEAGAEDRERSVAEPDVAILREWKPDYQHRHPRGNELLLAGEVSDTTAAFALSRKGALYARAGVPEYWVWDLKRRLLVVHRQSDGTRYKHVQFVSEAESVSMEGRAEAVKVADLPPAP